jgi:hypothetical protein
LSDDGKNVASLGEGVAVRVEELEACFIVKDDAGQKLAFVYFEEEPGRRSAAKLLTKNEARRVAEIIAKLPELVRPGLTVQASTKSFDPKPQFSSSKATI